MKRLLLLLCFIIGFSVYSTLNAQCSICSRTAAQMGEKPAKGLNTGIIYLALTPVTVVSIIAFCWWRKREAEEEPAL